MARPRRPLGIEQLEKRELKAGDVRAYFENGHLIVNEVPSARDQANQVMVLGLPNGQIRITTPPGGQTRIADPAGNNPLPYRDFTVPAGMTVSLSGGDDIVQIGQITRMGEVLAPNVRSLSIYTTPDAVGPTTGPDSDRVDIVALTARGVPAANGQEWTDLYVKTGRGDDQVTIGGWGQAIKLGVSSNNPSYKGRTQSRSTIDTGEGIDLVKMTGVTNSGPLTLETAGGDDQIELRNVTVGDIAGQDDLVINTGAGADRIRIDNSQVADHVTLRTHDHPSEADIDTLLLQGFSNSGDMDIYTGAGDDQVNLASCTIGGDLEVQTYEGADTVSLLNCVMADHLLAQMGNGDDTLLLDGVIAATAELLGEGDYDYVTFNRVDISQVIFSSWEEID